MEIFSYTLNELKEFFKKRSLPPFRASQVFDWIYNKRAQTFDEMSNLPKNLRESLQNNFTFFSLGKIEEVRSHNSETSKFLWKLSDGYYIESVLISSKERRTLCVSSQVGCKGGCAFCASGKEGFKRDLSTGEIIEQVVLIDQQLKEHEERISNIVFMGMGEPLDNFENVLRAIRILNDKEGLNISQRKITISTVGIIEMIDKLREEDLNVNLTLSLHAPNQSLRESLIPFAKKNDLTCLLASLKAYFQKTRRDITVEYILIDRINDSKNHARQLIEKLSPFDFKVNLIPYNPVEGLLFKRPSNNAILNFKNEVERGLIDVTQRFLKGDDITAACGQLALKQGDLKDFC